MRSYSTKFRNYVAKEDVRVRVLARTGGKCAYCGVDIVSAFTVDHVIPLSGGGTHDDANLVPACSQCNSVKGSRSLDRFRTLIGRRVHGVPRFSKEQEDWLMSVHGVCVDPPYYHFWFELHGLEDM